MPRAKPGSTDFNVRLRVQPGRTPAVIRLRHFLKLAWRAYGFKAVSVEELPAPEQPAGEALEDTP